MGRARHKEEGRLKIGWGREEWQEEDIRAKKKQKKKENSQRTAVLPRRPGMETEAVNATGK